MLKFLPWEPDKAAFDTPASMDVLNVVPSESGFRPFPSFFTVTSAITARAQGGVITRGLQGSIFNFAGDETKLYKEAADGLSFGDVSRLAGGAYATAADGWWDFSTFGDFCIATNGSDVPQAFQLDVSTNFAALGGTPPNASFVGVIRDFTVLARRDTAHNRLTWSAINDCEDWVTSATTLSDAQDFPDGGAIMGFVGGEFGIVFLEKGIWRMAFEGPPTVFRFDKIANLLGCRAERSIASYENLIFFLSDDGFYMIRGGSEIIPIGNEKIDREFEDTIDASYLFRVSSAIDPIRKLYLISFPSSGAAAGTPDSIWAYHWPSAQWSKVAPGNHEIIYIAATQTTYTIDGLDALAATIDGLPYPVDSRFYAGSGRLLLAGFNSSHQQGFFTGSALAPMVETSDYELNPGHKSLLLSARPMVEGLNVTPSLTILSRNSLQEAHAVSSAVPANAHGVCAFRVNARYHRARQTIAAASAWTFMRGIADINAQKMGKV